MVSRVASTSARAQLAASVAELNDLVLFADLNDAEIETVRATVDAMVDAHQGDRRAPWWDSDAPGRSYNLRSPFTGEENPRAPQLRIAHVDGDPTAAIGMVTVSSAFAGPPGAVHGGVLSGLFDEVIGWLASRVDPTAMVVTARLSVRYPKPTPLRVPLELHARIAKNTPRLVQVEAECRHDGAVTATAEALMVVRR